MTVSESDGTAVFTVTLDRVPVGSDEVTVDYATGAVGDTATAGSDYTTTGGTLTFDSGTTASLTITVPILNDALVEPSESFTVTLSSPSVNATITDATATGTITDEDYSIASIGDVTVSESDGTAVFTVTLDRVPVGSDEVTVDYATGAVGDTATAGSDYTTTGGTLTFDSGTTASLTITVPILNDALVEPSESFTVTLSSPSVNATITDATATGTITDEDFVIQSISDEGEAESVGTMNFTVTLNRAPVGTEVVTVHYATADGTAVDGSDYTADSGTLTFDSSTGATRPIAVTMLNDNLVESSENFTVTLSGPSGNATIASPTGTGTIIDDDTGDVVISASDASMAEPNDNGQFTVTMSNPSATAHHGQLHGDWHCNASRRLHHAFRDCRYSSQYDHSDHRCCGYRRQPDRRRRDGDPDSYGHQQRQYRPGLHHQRYGHHRR